MKTLERWKVLTFVGLLATIAILINTHFARRYASSTAQHGQSSDNLVFVRPVGESRAEPPPTPPPLVWPGDFKPTRIMKIPDPERPTSGVVDTTLSQRDEFQLEVAPFWSVRFHQSLPSGVELAIDDGTGFKIRDPDDASYQKTGQPRENVPWTKPRTMRLRLRPGSSQNADFRFTVTRQNPDEAKPLPRVPPQQFGSLTVTFRRLQSSGRTFILVDLDLKNTSDTKSVAVALYCAVPQDIPLEDVKTSLVASDGTELWIVKDEIAGIRYMNSNPQNLTEIGPNETRRISLKYQSQWGIEQKLHSFKLQAELAINSDYRASSYSPNYQARANVLPSNCKIYNLVMEIPVHDSRSLPNSP